MARDRYYWKGLQRDVEQYVGTCELCQVFARQRHLDELHPIYPRAMLFSWGLDLMVMPRAKRFRYVVLAREELSGFVEGRALRTNRTESVCRFVLEEIIARYGCFDRLRADRGELNAREATLFFERLGIRPNLSLAYNPEANGKIECGHQTVVAAMAKAVDGQVEAWPTFLPFALWRTE